MSEILTIAIVDDETIQLDSMTSLIQTAAIDLDVSLKLMAFSSGEQFIFELEELNTLDIVFLDIEMKQKDGLEVAKKIRETDKDLTIVFATAYAEYAVKGYDVQALDYLLKPIEADKIKRVLTRHLARKPAVEESITLESHGELIKIDLDNILFIEVTKRECEIHLFDQVITINRTLKEISEIVNDAFIQTHRSYLVNVKHINRLLKTDVELINGRKVPVSRRLTKDVQQKFVDFHKGSVFYNE